MKYQIIILISDKKFYTKYKANDTKVLLDRIEELKKRDSIEIVAPNGDTKLEIVNNENIIFSILYIS